MLMLRASLVIFSWLIFAPLWGYEAPKNAKFAFMNNELIEKKSDAWLAFVNRLNGEISKFQDNVKNIEQEIRSKENILQKKRAIISKIEYNQSQEKIQKETLELNKSFEIKKRQLDEVFIISRQILRDNIKKNATEIAKKYQIDAVINIKNDDSILLLRDSLEITGEVLNLLNYNLKEIPWTDPDKIIIKDVDLKPAVPLNKTK